MRDGARVRVELEGAKELAAQFDSVKIRAGPMMKIAVWQAAQLIRNAAVKGIMKGPKTGRVYGDHQASAKGEYPASDTGNLAKLIQQARVTTPLGPAVDVSSTASYAEALELKAPDRGGRPHLSRAFDEQREAVVAVLAAAVAAIFPGDRTANRK